MEGGKIKPRRRHYLRVHLYLNLYIWIHAYVYLCVLQVYGEKQMKTWQRVALKFPFSIPHNSFSSIFSVLPLLSFPYYLPLFSIHFSPHVWHGGLHSAPSNECAWVAVWAWINIYIYIYIHKYAETFMISCLHHSTAT